MEEGLFDYLAKEKEEGEVSKYKPKCDFKTLHPCITDWKFCDNRPIFRISAAAALCRNDPNCLPTSCRQRTQIVHTYGDRSIGGLVFPMDILNASYVFHTECGPLDLDNGQIRKALGIDSPKRNLNAYEWDLGIYYKPTDKKNPMETAQAYITGATFRPLLRPQFSPALPVPSDKQDWRCIDSGTTRQALVSINAALASGRPPLVLITGSPGSGKEAYAKALHFGRAEYWDKDKGLPKKEASKSYKVYSLAETDIQNIERTLTKELQDLVGRKGGTVFFDEADKASEEVRSHLLRLLEERRYRSSYARKPIDCEEITFVVGAGERLGALKKKNPPDFWTRMEIHIEVGDPLMAPTTEEREVVIESFFRHFWWDLTSSWLQGIIGKPKGRDWEQVFREKEAARLIAESVFLYAIGSVNEGELEGSNTPKRVAKCFAQNLGPHLERRELSIRGLRSCVKSITWEIGSALLGLVVKDPKCIQTIETEMETLSQRAVARAVGTVLQVLPA